MCYTFDIKQMNLNPVNLVVKAWGQAHDSASVAATNSRVMREVLRSVNIGCMAAIGFTLWQTFDLIGAGKVDLVAGTLIGGIFTFLGGVLSVSIPSLVTALKASEKTTPVVPPPTITTPPNGDNA